MAIVDLHPRRPRPNMRSSAAAQQGGGRASAPIVSVGSDCNRSLSSQTTVRFSNVSTPRIGSRTSSRTSRLREQLARLLAQQNEQLRKLEEEIDQLERSCVSSQGSDVERALLEVKQLERNRLNGFMQGLEAVLASANRHDVPPGDVTVLESGQPSSSSVSGSASVPSNRADTGGTVAGSPVTHRTDTTTTGTGSLPGDGPRDAGVARQTTSLLCHGHH